MDTFARKRRVADLRDHLAEERTFLARVRLPAGRLEAFLENIRLDQGSG